MGNPRPSTPNTAELGPASAETKAAESSSDTMGRSAEHKSAFWCTFIVVASAILLPASTDYAREWKGLGDYAIVVSAVSLGLGLLMTIWYKVIAEDNSSLRKTCMELPLFGPLNMEMVIAAFLTGWSIVGASIMTFQGPHLIPGNGYFSAWGNAFASVGYLANTSGRSMSAIGTSILRGSGALHALIVPSVVLIIAVTKQYCIDSTCMSFLGTSRYTKESALGLCAGVISLAFILVVAPVANRMDSLDNGAKQATQWVHKMVSLVLLGVWIAAFIVLTFHEPFDRTGNGYFALVIGLVLSVAFALHQFPDLEKAIEKTTS